ncbi:hypothetical protein BDZ45DRAFT_238937 [Acephala macrosclerotiorum]|nr:hypothetical protein BDZ45DRAFT_238937 [Acephala macrosclerotiorum]
MRKRKRMRLRLDSPHFASFGLGLFFEFCLRLTASLQGPCLDELLCFIASVISRTYQAEHESLSHAYQPHSLLTCSKLHRCSAKYGHVFFRHPSCNCFRQLAIFSDSHGVLVPKLPTVGASRVSGRDEEAISNCLGRTTALTLHLNSWSSHKPFENR